MKYDFDQVVDRRNTNSYKWNVKENELPMWVADMDFPAAPEIRKALQERLDHGVFGYADLPEEWYDAYINWWGRRHGFTIEKDWLPFFYRSPAIPFVHCAQIDDTGGECSRHDTGL